MTDVMSTSKKSKAPKLLSDELIDQLLAQVQDKYAESILAESGLAGQLKKRLAERMLAAELTHHLRDVSGIMRWSSPPHERGLRL